jgi:hypothetical protein
LLKVPSEEYLNKSIGLEATAYRVTADSNVFLRTPIVNEGANEEKWFSLVDFYRDFVYAGGKTS